jgi:ELWxxDGT repeat protein
LWRTDGTPLGTGPVLDAGGQVVDNPGLLTAVGSDLYFAAQGASGFVLWSVNSATGVAEPVTKGVGAQLVNPASLTAVGTDLYFASGPFGGKVLWKVNGATGGAEVVTNGGGSQVPVADFPVLAALGTDLLFASGSQTLWKVNGATGTAAELPSSSGTSVLNPAVFRTIGGRAYFRANSGLGSELWMSDGTSPGTMLAADIQPGAPGSDPIVLGDAGGRLIVQADDGARGKEPFFLNMAPTGNTAPTLDPIVPQLTTPGQEVRFRVLGNDPDIGQVLSFSLDSPPTGATINPQTGIVSWVPSTPGNATLRVRVSDGVTSTTSDVSVSTVVNPVATTTTLQVSAPTITVGQSVDLTAFVAPATATGTVSFFNGGTLLGTVAVVNGVAGLNVPNLPVGTFGFRADYSGDALHDVSGGQASVTVNPAISATTTTLQASAPTINEGQSVDLTAFVAPATATGTVSFFNGGTLLGTVAVVNGMAGLNVPNLPVGTFGFRADYSGDARHTASGGQASVTVNRVPPAMITGVTLVRRQNLISAIVLNVSGSFNAADAANLANFTLAYAGNDRKYGTRDDRKIRLAGVQYDPAAGTMTLVPPRNRLRLTANARLLVQGLRDSLDRPYDGDRNGTPGGLFAALLNSRKARIVTAASS